ncbi:DUF294 nucleotidyltransferase-like domain-containing protein [Natranaerofaba carboxydovora]|uniref:DUF294 nucleotidyltransferase-like domain-containing protein n=1 Tax=Natranaerofaba carboxydovora TaxID=2742683 RepID=UPI001F13A33F|nr:DUF294 nucleotidyltransferase-like domain-containing protein [Natranaerofaba carboxydovora]UMZ73764.1 cAMP-activated global transcriptional regulator CRP [Natranaerofaba carboxydovora]
MYYFDCEISTDYKQLIQNLEPFTFIKEDTLRSFLEKLQIRRYPEGSYVFRQGESNKEVIFIVLKGRIELLTKDNQGRQVKQYEIIPHNFFGTPTFFSDGRYALSAKVAETTDCLILDNETFRKLASETPKFSRHFKKNLGERLKSIYESYITVEKNSSLSQYFKNNNHLWIPIEEKMKKPVVVCNKEDSVKRVARIMEHNDVSSVIVLDNNNKLYGIITEKDLVQNVIANEISPKYNKAEGICHENVITLPPDEYMYKALVLMVKYRLKHMVITDPNNEPIGILSLRDLIKSKKLGAIYISNKIDKAKAFDDLLHSKNDIDFLMIELVKERTSTRITCEIINEYYDQLNRKIIKLAEDEMIQEGHGEPPVNYSFITMGSNGRREQLMITDMDNGIIYADPIKQNEQEVKDYFLKLGEKIIFGLIKCGFNECHDNVMANNPKWCRSFKSWRALVKSWTDSPNEKNTKSMSIFLDFRHLYGDKKYYDLLKNFVLRQFRESTVAHHYIVKNAMTTRPIISTFRRIKAKKDREYGRYIDLKESACVQIVDSIKVFALREGIIETNTHERLSQLEEKNVFNKDQAKFIQAAYETFMMYRLKENVEKKERREVPNNYLSLKDLSVWETNNLKDSLSTVDKLLNLATKSFHAYV